MKGPNGVESELFPQYVEDYVWRRRFGTDTGSAMFNLWSQIAEFYPGDVE
jgi:hypothetical protein